MQWPSAPTWYSHKENDHPHNGNTYNDPSQSPSNTSNQSYKAVAVMVENAPTKKTSGHHSYQQPSSAHVSAQINYMPRPQIVPPPPPPQSLPVSVSSIPTVPFNAQTRTGSPFMVYHVCRTCHQPRSKSYHHRHPVRAGGPMPDPTTCSRCKQSKNTRDQSSLNRRTDEVALDDGSRLGSHLEKEKHCVSEWIAKSTAPSNALSNKQPEPRQSHAKVETRVCIEEGESPGRSDSSRRVEAPNSAEAIHEFSHAAGWNAVEPLSPRSAAATSQSVNLYMTSALWTQPAPTPPDPSRQPFSQDESLTSFKVREIAQSEIRRAQATALPIYAPVLLHRFQPMTSSDVRKIAAEEAMRHATKVASPSPGTEGDTPKSFSITPSEVQKIARNEIQHYRAAERAIASHPRSFSHGYVEAVATTSAQGAPISASADQPSLQSDHNTQAIFGASSQRATGGAEQSRVEPFHHENKWSAEVPSMKGRSDAEYFFMSRKAEVVPHPPPFTSHLPSDLKPDTAHLVTGKDVVEGWSGATRERPCKDVEVSYDQPDADRKSAFTMGGETIRPNSSVSQRPARDSGPKRERPPSGHHVQHLSEIHRPPVLHSFHDGTHRYSRDVNVSQVPDGTSNAAGSNTVRLVASAAVDKEARSYSTASRPTPGSETYLQKAMGVHDVRRSHSEVAEESSGRPYSSATKSSAQYDPPPPRERFEGSRARHAYFDDANTGLVVDQRPVGHTTYVRKTYVSPSTNLSRDSDELTVWPGHVPDKSRNEKIPLDSVAMHEQRMEGRQGGERREPPPQKVTDEPYIVPRGSVRRRPSPPREEDITRDDRRIYRERTPSKERVVTERIVRMSNRSSEKREHRSKTPRANFSPARYAPRYDGDPRFEEASQHPRSILRSSSNSPGDGISFYSNAHVKFASKDNIAPASSTRRSDAEDSTRTRGASRFHRVHNNHGFDGPNSHNSSSDEYYYERERGRTSRRYENVQGIEEYKPEMNHVLTRALSESPSRERVDDLKKKAEKKRVKVEVVSDAHGPFRAELSPTLSMEVLTNGSQISYGSPKPGRTDANAGRLQRKLATISDGPESIEPGWLKVTTVKQYVSADGRPYEVVEEKIVLDDQMPPKSKASGGLRDATYD